MAILAKLKCRLMTRFWYVTFKILCYHGRTMSYRDADEVDVSAVERPRNSRQRTRLISFTVGFGVASIVFALGLWIWLWSRGQLATNATLAPAPTDAKSP